uniref:Movement protein n=1 Tax=Sugarcane chlorotic streak virus TaxID=1919062 RepID=A0A1J0MU95_9GEMI|nr:movement protein [Sugarcane chlorotic streak virus]
MWDRTMEGFYQAPPLLPLTVRPQVAVAAPYSGSLPWSRVGEVAIFTFVAVLGLYLLWLWVLRDLFFVVKAQRGRSTEELHFGPTEVPSVPSARVDLSAPPVGPSGTAPPRPFLG